MPSCPWKTIFRRVVIAQIFTPNQLNQPQLSILLRQIHHSRYQHNFDLLTKRETKIMGLIHNGKIDSKISELLDIEILTAKKPRDNIMRKLGSHNTAQLMALISGMASVIEEKNDTAITQGQTMVSFVAERAK
jgi:DNA-binding NarL/FixJ family response regulator